MFTLIALSVFPLVVSIVWVLYRIGLYFWDPKDLRKYPGLNPLCGFTNLAYIWAIWRAGGFRTRTLAEAHRSHNVLRLGPNSLSFADVRAIKDIYGHSTSCTKGDMYSTTAGSHRSLLDSVDKLEHSAKRKRLAAAFSAKHLEKWEFKVHDKCTRLIAQLDRYCLFPREMDKSEDQLQRNIIDWRHWSNLFTVEAISDIAVSERLGLMESGNDKMLAEDSQGNSRTVNFVESLHGIGRMAAPIVWSGVGYPVLKKSLSIASPSYRQQVICNDNYDNIIRHLVSKRMAQYRSGIKHDDFFACLLEDKQGLSTNLNLGEIASEVNVFSEYNLECDCDDSMGTDCASECRI
jgi:benzoate 4-monooxygenase